MTGSTYHLVTKLGEHHIHDLHGLYRGEWWTRGRGLGDVRRMLEHSDFVFGFSDVPGDRLVAFARVLTDRVFKALVFDVIVANEHRGDGLGRRLMERIIRHPDLENVRHMELYCLPDMVGFYEKWGFSTDVSGVSLMRRQTPRGASSAVEREASS